MVEVDTGGLEIEVHTCFSCFTGLAKGLQYGAGIGFEDLEMVETSHSAVLGEGL